MVLGPFPDGAPGRSGVSSVQVHEPRRGKNPSFSFRAGKEDRVGGLLRSIMAAAAGIGQRIVKDHQG